MIIKFSRDYIEIIKPKYFFKMRNMFAIINMLLEDPLLRCFISNP